MKQWMILIIALILLISCSTNAEVDPDKEKSSNDLSSETMYHVESDKYSNNNINIVYPKIVDFPNNKYVENINVLIREEAKRIINLYPQEKDNLDINYRIMLKSNELISIKYYGSGFTEGAAYPLNVFYTSNIDLNKRTRVKLMDLIEINESFVKEFKEGKYKSYDGNLDLFDHGVNEEILSGYNNEDLLNYLKHSDEVDQLNESGTFSYITPDSIGISISVPHALGDHLEMEISFSNLINNIKEENKLMLQSIGEE
ncbi:hypothetical protein [Paenibacillus sp. FSL H8-0079]|uniref:hypothetical protein n=1 Tax=Paenibacillus sp. FSL H8-0079 TaxID=2921375 RepID=UPI0030EF0F72